LYYMVYTLLSDALRVRWLQDNYNPDECLDAQNPCLLAGQSCINLMNGYTCGPCVAAPNSLLDTALGRCVAPTGPLLYNRTLFTGYVGRIYIRGRRIWTNESITCEVTGAQTLGTQVNTEDWAVNGAMGWTGPRLGITRCGSHTLLGGFGVTGMGHFLTRVYNVGKHSGASIT
jgi:hypothetical protein